MEFKTAISNPCDPNSLFVGTKSGKLVKIDFNESFQARFYGIPLDFIGYRKERLKDWFSNRFRFPVFVLTDKKLEKFISVFKNLAIFFSTSNAISNFLTKASFTIGVGAYRFATSLILSFRLTIFLCITLLSA